MHHLILVRLKSNTLMQIAHEMYLLMHFANEPQSTKAILNKVESYNYPYTKK